MGDVVDGMEVGADTTIAWPTTTAACLIEEIDAFASGVSKSSAPTDAAARSNSLEKVPVETEAVTLSEIDLVRSSGEDDPSLLSTELVIANEMDVLGDETGAGVGVLGFETGEKVGAIVGTLVGDIVGFTVGFGVGLSDGEKVGFRDGLGEGAKVGANENVGSAVGIGEGSGVGSKVGLSVRARTSFFNVTIAF